MNRIASRRIYGSEPPKTCCKAELAVFSVVASELPARLAEARCDCWPHRCGGRVPQAMAYATIAELPVQVGLYTAFMPMLIYAWLGTSRMLSVSTTATIAILTGEALDKFAPQGE